MSKTPKWIKGFVSHPITGFFVGIAGIVLAIYFYFAGITKPNLIFLLHPIRTPIVLAGNLSDISVSLRGKPINGNLTAAQFIIWNSGKTPVRHEDILKPIVLLTTSNSPIYKATIRNVSRDVVRFQLITNEMNSGRLSFDWKILEHNDGASIQVLYGGDHKMVFFESDGVVVGQRQVPFEILDVEHQSLKSTVFGVFGFLILALLCAAGTKSCIKELIKAIHNKKNWKLILVNVLMVITCGVITILSCIVALLSFFAKNAPPFDF